jgi:hypothetical protein
MKQGWRKPAFFVGVDFVKMLCVKLSAMICAKMERD